MREIVKGLVVSALLLLICAPLQAQYFLGQSKKLDVDEFVIAPPTELKEGIASDTADLDTSFDYCILDKQVTYYFYFQGNSNNGSVKRGLLTAVTEYIRDKGELERLKDLSLTSKTDYGFKIYKRSGEEVMIEEEKSSEFNEELESELESGCIVQYYYLKSNYGNAYYNSINLRAKVPVKNSEIYLQTEDKLTYKAKGYNGVEEIMDSSISGFQVLGFRASNLEEIRKEKLAIPSISNPKVYYTIKYNKHWTDKIIYDFQHAARYYYGEYFYIAPQNTKALKSLYSKIGVNETDEVEDKIIKIDKYITDNFKRSYGNSNNTLAKVLSTKKMGTTGAAKLYVALLKEAEVKTEVALTTNFFQHKFDKKFQTWTYLDLLYLYFPKTKKYLSPSDVNSGYGEIPSTCRGNYALHIFPYEFGDITSPKGKVRKIKESDYSKNLEVMNLTIEVNPEKTSQTISFEQELKGEMGSMYRGKIEDLDFDDEQEIFNYQCKDIDKYAWPNDDYNIAMDEENVFTMRGSFVSDSLLTKEEDQILFKAGLLMGHVLILEDTAKRISAAGTVPFHRDKKVSIVVPDGYEISGLDAFNMSFKAEKKGKETLNYELKAERKGNVITITLSETFKKMIFTSEEYPDFKKQNDLGIEVRKLNLILRKKA